MEGTGIAGGLACLLAAIVKGHAYVVSSGDAVGPFIAVHVRCLGWPFAVYERLLCRFSSGFIGWTPYLVGVLSRLERHEESLRRLVLGGNVMSTIEDRLHYRRPGVCRKIQSFMDWWDQSFGIAGENIAMD